METNDLEKKNHDTIHQRVAVHKNNIVQQRFGCEKQQLMPEISF